MKTHETQPSLQTGAAVWFYHPTGPARFGIIHRLVKSNQVARVHYLKAPGMYAVASVPVEAVTGEAGYTPAKKAAWIRKIARETKARDGRSTKAARVAIDEIMKTLA